MMINNQNINIIYPPVTEETKGTTPEDKAQTENDAGEGDKKRMKGLLDEEEEDDKKNQKDAGYIEVRNIYF